MDAIAVTIFQCTLNSPFDDIPAPEYAASLMPDDEDFRSLFITVSMSYYWTPDWSPEPSRVLNGQPAGVR